MTTAARALVVACGATALLLLDVTVVYVALPTVGADLGASFGELQWVVDAYALTMAALLLPAGALADRRGRRAVTLAGLLVFGVASAACALAPSAPALDLARAAQGAGAALLFATSLALIGATTTGEARGRALGTWGAVSGIALAAGPVVGGLVVEAVGWEAIFWANVPAVAALALVARGVPESRDAAAPPPDLAGAALLAAGLGLLVAGLLHDGEVAIAGAAVLGAFVWWERRAAAPMLDLRWFAERRFAGTAAVALLQSVALYPVLLFLTVYLQVVQGFGALGAGLRVLPITAALLLAAPLAGRLTARVPLGPLLAGSLVGVAAGLGLCATVEAGDPWTALLPGFVVLGLAIGVLSPALAAAMLEALPGDRHGLATGVGNTCRQTGIAMGVALLGAVFTASSPVALDEVAAGGAVAEAAFVEGLRDVLLVAAGAALLGAVAGLAIGRRAPA